MKKIYGIVISLALVIITFVFAGCNQSSGGDISSEIRSMENLKDVINDGEDLSGTWSISEMYLRIISEEDGEIKDNFESSDIHDIINNYGKDAKNKNEYGEDEGDEIDLPDECMTFTTKEEAAEYFLDYIKKQENNFKSNKSNYQNSIYMMQAFGGNITKSNYKEEVYIKVSEDRKQIKQENYMEFELQGSMWGQNINSKGKMKLRFVLTRNEEKE